MLSEILQKVQEPETFKAIVGVISLVLYLSGRITKQQFVVEQEKAKGITAKENAKDAMVQKVLGPIGPILDAVDQIPLVNTKIPVLNTSIPSLAKDILSGAIGLFGDILHGSPGKGTNVATPANQNGGGI